MGASLFSCQTYLSSFQGLSSCSALDLTKLDLSFLSAKVKLFLAARNSCLEERDLCSACLQRADFIKLWSFSRSADYHDFEEMGCLREQALVARS